MTQSLVNIRSLAKSFRHSSTLSYINHTRNGDPGPQAARFRKSQRRDMREGHKTKSIGSLNHLEQMFNADQADVARHSPRKVNARAQSE